MSYSSEVLADSPLAFYHLDETSGTTLTDSSGNGRDGTWTGSPTRGVTGAQGTAFTTGGGYASVPDASWNSFTSAFSIELWHKPNNVDGYLLEKYAGGFAARIESKRFKVYTLGASTTTITAPFAATNNQWHHYVFTFDGTNGRLYIDGALVAGPTAMAAPTDGTATLKIGARGDDAVANSCGGLDEVALYTGALSGSRVTAHYDAGAAARDTSPKAWWKLDETSGTTMADSSGNGRDGTYSGAILNQTALRGSGAAAKGGTTGQGVASVTAAANSVFDTGDFTIAFNLQLTNTTSGKGFISRWSSAGWILWMSAGKVSFYMDDGISADDLAGPTVSTGANKRMTLVVKSGQALLYMDGTLSTTWTLTKARPSASTALQIGGYNSANYSEAIFDDIKWWDCALTAGEVAYEYSPSSAVSVSVPVMAVVEAAPAPVVTPGVRISVAAPALAVVAALLAPSVSAGTGVRVDAPTLAVTTAVPAPTVTMSANITVAAPVLGVVAAVAAPDVLAGSTVTVAAPVLDLSVAIPGPTVDVSHSITVAAPLLEASYALLAPTVTVPTGVTVDAPELATSIAVIAPYVSLLDWTPGDVLPLTAPSPRYAAVTSFEVVYPTPDVLLLCAPSVHGGTLRVQPVALPLPDGVTDRPIRRQVHLMEPKTPENPRKMGDPLRARADGDDGYLYPIEESDVGRVKVFVSGVDITYYTGAPTTWHEIGFAKPFGPQSASFTVPLPEWNYPGPYAGPHGNDPIFWGDAPVEVALEDSEGNLHHLWEGYTGEESDTAAPGQTGVTFNCEGTFQQAAHWLNDPPAVMDPRDVGHVIADALNAVPNRRWNKIKRFTTGVPTENKGDSSQSVLAYVADLIGGAFNDDGQQLRLVRTGPYAYELAWSALAIDPDWTYTKGSPGFDMTLARPHNARRDMVFGRGIAPDGGFWMNRHFPGLAANTPPVYPMPGFGNMVVGTTDADTSNGIGVTQWQRRMRELGYPVKVDGVMNSSDTKWVVEIERKRGISDTGVLGPQTWSATWEGGNRAPETDTVRLPLDDKDIAKQWLRDAAGTILGPNPTFDKFRVIHATPEVDFGTNIKKSAAKPQAHLIRTREASPGYVGSLTANGVDPQEPNASRLFIADGHNVLVDGHHLGTVVQVSDVTHTPTSTRMTVDSGARGQAVVDAVLTRARDTRRSLSGKSTKLTDRGALNASQLGQYESESPAGKYSRTAINGDDGLWTVRCIYVAEQGLARFRLTTSPNAEIVTLICGRKITANQVAAIVPDPLGSSEGWYEAEEELREKFALVEVCGTPDSPGGYFPWQKSDGKGLTGVQAVGNLSMKSQRGGFFWVAAFTSRSTFLEGEFEPEVSTA